MCVWGDEYDGRHQLLAELEVHLLDEPRLVGDVGLGRVDGPVGVVLDLGRNLQGRDVGGVRVWRGVTGGLLNW